MPPVRTVSAVKPLKTERTHEENQERAYIAASRRSDRSLEARVESARRASEIHKRRTGRSLRVTEQDVVNEEMYEEEDDDLPLQYRRLTAHLQTGSTDFNRRLAAYLTNQVAVRSALDQAMSSSYAQYPQQSPHGAPFPPGQAPYPSPMLPPHMMQHSPGGYRTSPYPMATSPQALRPQAHHRSMSMATTPSDRPQLRPGFMSAGASPIDGPEMRHMSLPGGNNNNNTVMSPSPLQQDTASPHPLSPGETRADGHSDAGQQQQQQSFFGPDGMQRTMSGSQQQAAFLPQQQFWPQALHLEQSPSANIAPFSTSLPTESQLMLGHTLDPTDPFTSILLAGSGHVPQPFYRYNPHPSVKGATSAAAGATQTPREDGINQTLAPGALDTAALGGGATNWSAMPLSAAADSAVSYNSGFSYPFEESGDGFKQSMTRSNSDGASADVTPAEGHWTNLLDGSYFEDAPPA